MSVTIWIYWETLPKDCKIEALRVKLKEFQSQENWMFWKQTAENYILYICKGKDTPENCETYIKNTLKSIQSEQNIKLPNNKLVFKVCIRHLYDSTYGIAKREFMDGNYIDDIEFSIQESDEGCAPLGKINGKNIREFIDTLAGAITKPKYQKGSFRKSLVIIGKADDNGLGKIYSEFAGESYTIEGEEWTIEFWPEASFEEKQEEFKVHLTQHEQSSFYIFWHSVSQDFVKELKDKVNNIRFIKGFHHEKGDKIYDIFTRKNPEDIIKEIKVYIISLLVHRLAHVFLPLDIDLQGICDVLSPTFIPASDKSKEEWAQKYYDEVFNDKGSPQVVFEEKLEKAKKIVEREALDGEVKNQILDKLKNNGVKKLRNQLEPKADLETFKSWVENRNPFHSWFCGLTEYLNKIKVES